MVVGVGVVAGVQSLLLDCLVMQDPKSTPALDIQQFQKNPFLYDFSKNFWRKYDLH